MLHWSTSRPHRRSSKPLTQWQTKALTSSLPPFKHGLDAHSSTLERGREYWLQSWDVCSVDWKSCCVYWDTHTEEAELRLLCKLRSRGHNLRLWCEENGVGGVHWWNRRLKNCLSVLVVSICGESVKSRMCSSLKIWVEVSGQIRRSDRNQSIAQLDAMCRLSVNRRTGHLKLWYDVYQLTKLDCTT